MTDTIEPTHGSFEWAGLRIEYQAVLQDDLPKVHFILFKRDGFWGKGDWVEADRGSIMLEWLGDLRDDEAVREKIKAYIEAYHHFLLGPDFEVKHGPK